MISNTQTTMKVSDEKWNKIFKKQKPIILAFGHKARQGKDYIAEQLQKEYGGTIVKFADELYKEVTTNDIIPLLSVITLGSYVYLSIRDKQGEGKLVDASLVPDAVQFLVSRNTTKYSYMREKDSQFLQLWGTDIRRKLNGEDYWVNKFKENLPNDKMIYVTDVRFKNEYDCIKSMGGYYIDVRRFNDDGTRYVAPDRDPYHISETDLDDVQADLVISGKSGNLEDLVAQAKNFMNTLIQK